MKIHQIIYVLILHDWHNQTSQETQIHSLDIPSHSLFFSIFFIIISSNTEQILFISVYFLMTRQINKSNLKGMIFCFVFPKSISSRTMFCTKVTYDSRVVDNMLSFYVNTQINLLPEGMVTIHATKLKIANLHDL